MEHDFYVVLGISDDKCTKAEITAAFRKKALECHPDKKPNDPDAHEKFLLVSKAFEILSNDRARAAYDYLRRLAAESKRQRDITVDSSPTKTQTCSQKIPTSNSENQFNHENQHNKSNQFSQSQEADGKTDRSQSSKVPRSYSVTSKKASHQHYRGNGYRENQQEPLRQPSYQKGHPGDEHSKRPDQFKSARPDNPIKQRHQHSRSSKDGTSNDESTNIGNGPIRPQPTSVRKDNSRISIGGNSNDMELIGHFGHVTISGDGHRCEILGDDWTVNLSGRGHLVTLCGRGGVISIKGRSHHVRMHGDHGVVELSGQNHRVETLGDDLVFRKVKIFKDFELKFKLR